MPRSPEVLEQLLTPNLNSDDHFTLEELADLIREFILIEESLYHSEPDKKSDFKHKHLLKRATNLLDEQRIKQLAAAEYFEVFYLIQYNPNILRHIPIQPEGTGFIV